MLTFFCCCCQILFNFTFFFLIWKRARAREREYAIERMCACWQGPGRSQEARNSIQIFHLSGGDPSSWVITYSLVGCVSAGSWKWEEPGLEPGHSDTACRHLKWHLNSSAKRHPLSSPKCFCLAFLCVSSISGRLLRSAPCDYLCYFPNEHKFSPFVRFNWWYLFAVLGEGQTSKKKGF